MDLSSTVTPTEAQLIPALTLLRSQNPTLGIPKIHSLLLSNNPEWNVSEKRTRKILRDRGLTLTSTPNAKENGKMYPSSKLIDKLDVGRWTNKVDVRYFDKKKGKGLVARDKIVKDEVIWKEDPFVIAPEWEIYRLISTSLACAFCTTPLGNSTLIVSCPSASTSSHCPARYCNRLCQSRSQKLNHPLLCPARNPGSVPAIQFAKDNGWLGLHALVQSTARILLASQEIGESSQFEDDWRIFGSFAALGMEERGVWMGTREPLHPIWKKAFSLYKHALWEPTTDSDKKKLTKILKRPLDASVKKEIEDELFTYEGFLRNLGRINLNLEGHGGLYTLHSHMNHSCIPNVSIRHLHQSSNLSRISIVAKSDIEIGEEIFISYVDPSLPLSPRREKLREWSFGTCECARCVEEEKEGSQGASQGGGEEVKLDDLERELKAGFGVF